MRLLQLPLAPCKLLHPQSRHGFDQILDFTSFCTLILPSRLISLAYAVCSSLPIASFRPCRYQQCPSESDCLPYDQDDICFFQQTGIAKSAGQKKDRNHLRLLPSEVIVLSKLINNYYSDFKTMIPYPYSSIWILCSISRLASAVPSAIFFL